MRTAILRDAYDILLNRIEEIKKEIKKNTKDIARAADFGDLSENAEYDAAKERQSELFMTKNNLESYVSARIIEEEDINTEVVSFGTTVKLFDFTHNEFVSYTLAGPVEFEFEIYPSIMTFTSPLGQALNGKKKGALVDIELPKGTTKFLILDIKAISKTAVHSPDIAILGHVGYDVIHIDDTEKGRFSGGSAFHTGIGVACCTNEFALVTRVGKSDKELLGAVSGLNCSKHGIKKVDNSSSPEFKLYYSSNNKDDLTKRSVSLGCGSDISFEDLPSALYSARFLHLSASTPEQQLSWLTEIRKEKKIDCKISIDISEQYIKDQKDALLKLLPQCDIIFANEKEYELVKKAKISDETVVIKKVSDGSELWIDDELEDEASALDIEAVDPTGSAGVFAGAFLAVHALGHDEETAMDLATRIASKSKADFGVEHLIQVKHE